MNSKHLLRFYVIVISSMFIAVSLPSSNWYEAEKVCAEQYSRLPTFNDVSNTDTKQIFDKTRLFWLGGKFVHNSWKWEDGDQLYHHVGCFLIPADQSKRRTEKALEVVDCFRICRSQNVGMQTNHCFCLHDVSSYLKRPSNECFYPCWNNFSELCGGSRTLNMYQKATDLFPWSPNPDDLLDNCAYLYRPPANVPNYSSVTMKTDKCDDQSIQRRPFFCQKCRKCSVEGHVTYLTWNQSENYCHLARVTKSDNPPFKFPNYAEEYYWIGLRKSPSLWKWTKDTRVVQNFPGRQTGEITKCLAGRRYADSIVMTPLPCSTVLSFACVIENTTSTSRMSTLSETLASSPSMTLKVHTSIKSSTISMTSAFRNKSTTLTTATITGPNITESTKFNTATSSKSTFKHTSANSSATTLKLAAATPTTSSTSSTTLLNTKDHVTTAATKTTSTITPVSRKSAAKAFGTNNTSVAKILQPTPISRKIAESSAFSKFQASFTTPKSSLHTNRTSTLKISSAAIITRETTTVTLREVTKISADVQSSAVSASVNFTTADTPKENSNVTPMHPSENKTKVLYVVLSITGGLVFIGICTAVLVYVIREKRRQHRSMLYDVTVTENDDDKDVWNNVRLVVTDNSIYGKTVKRVRMHSFKNLMSHAKIPTLRRVASGADNSNHLTTVPVSHGLKSSADVPDPVRPFPFDFANSVAH